MQMPYAGLMREIRLASTSTRLSAALCYELELLSPQERSQLVNRTYDGITPLFTAAQQGAVEIVRYLLETCGANSDDQISDIERMWISSYVMRHYGTPLWVAAFYGNIEVCRVLVTHGADVNKMSVTSSTPVHAACCNNKIDVVKFLVGQGADVNRPDHKGSTCLIDSVRSTELCAFLLEQGVDINARDLKLKTALHYAVQANQCKTIELLLKNGADHLARSVHGDDVLQTACITRCDSVMYLIRTMNYPPERVADALELLGASYLFEDDNREIALKCWRLAVTHRELHKIEKKITEPPKDVFLNRVPFYTLDDVNALAHDNDEMWMQGLIVSERVLGSSHKNSILWVLERGRLYFKRKQHQRCIDLWKYGLEIRLSMDTVLHDETCIVLKSLINVMFDAHEEHSQGLFNAPVRLSDVMFLLEKLTVWSPAVMQQLEQRPFFREQQDDWDDVLNVVIHLLHLAEILPKSAESTLQLERMARKLVAVNPIMKNGNTLLHMAVGEMSDLRYCYFDYPRRFPDPIFPDPATTRLLLRVGAQVEAVNENGSTPLHIALLPVNYREQIVRMLLDAGAHIDRTNKQGERPYHMLDATHGAELRSLKCRLTLKCLAARKVKSHHRNYERLIPRSVEDFIRMH